MSSFSLTPCCTGVDVLDEVEYPESILVLSIASSIACISMEWNVFW